MADRFWNKLISGLGRTVAVSVTACALVCVIVPLLAYLIFKGVAAAVIAGVICIAASVPYSIYLARRVITPLQETDRRLTSLANGDLTSPVKVYSGSNEIASITRSLDKATYAMRGYVSEISSGLDKIAQGDLASDINGEWNGDFAEIRNNYDKVTRDLRKVFSDIDTASGQVNSGSQQVADGAQMLSQGAMMQAQSITELSEQLSDIEAKVSANAEAARKTTEIVGMTTERINTCSAEMSAMLAAIDEINTSSGEISKIIKVIDDIAFQTNILALNAAVEAAHAGAAGKGFAVVADEVRNLAAKSAEAASQTTTLIQGSIDSVRKGSEIAKNTAAVLDGIVSGAKEISREIENISFATSKQSEAIRQINTGVDAISAVIHNNTSTAEESAAASEELSGQSNVLKTMLSHFRFNEKSSMDQTGDSSKFYTSYSETHTPSYGEFVPAEDKKPSAPAEEYKAPKPAYVYEPVSEPVREPVSEPVSEPVPKPVPEPVPEPVPASDPEPVSAPAPASSFIDNSRDEDVEFKPMTFNPDDYDDIPKPPKDELAALKKKRTIVLDDDFENVESKY